MEVINLGVVTPYDPPAPGRPDLRRYLRLCLIVLIAVLSVVVLTASAPSGPHSFATLWRVGLSGDEDSFAMDTDGVYVMSTAGGRRITAYEPRTGVSRWTRTALEGTSWIGTIGAGVLLTIANRAGATETIAISTATGQDLWRQVGDSIAISGGRVLLADADPTSSAVRNLHVIDLATGAIAWSYTATDRRTWIATADADADADRIVIVTEDGQVAVHDFATGRVVVQGRVPWSGGGDNPGQSQDVGVSGHTFYLPGATGDRAAMTMYDTETLRERWHLPSQPFDSFYTCGPSLCLNDSAGLTVLDPDSGKKLWQRAGDGFGLALPNGQFIITNDPDGAEHVLVDGRTGRQLANYGTGALTYGYGASGPVYVLSLSQQPQGLTAVSELNESTGDMGLRGVIEPAAGNCQAIGRVLACYTTGSRLTVTEIGRVP